MAAHPRRGELAALPVLAVGRGSAEAARAAGFADVASADGDGGDLARLAAARFDGLAAPLLYLAGEDRARDLGGELSARGLSVRTVVVYRAVQGGGFRPPHGRRWRAADRRRAAFLPAQRRELSRLRRGHHRAGAGARALLPVGAGRRAAAAAGATQVRVAAQPDEARLLALVTPQSAIRIV